MSTDRVMDDCSPAICTNGKCNQTGECIEQVAQEMRALGATLPRVAYDCVIDTPIPRVESPSLVPNATTIAALEELERGGGITVNEKLERCPGCDGYSCDNGCAFPGAVSPPHATQRTIVAFTGLAGSGKSTAAAYLVERHGFQRVRFAGPLKAMMVALGCTHEQIDGSEKETPCDLLGGKTPRHAMQTLGTEWGRNLITPDLWIRAWQNAVAKVPAGVPVVVDDCRFPNEAEAVRFAGGVIVRIERPGAGTASVHASEQHVLPAVETLRNIADERYLFDQVDILMMDLSWRGQSASTGSS
jgi:hypothetical protein